MLDASPKKPTSAPRTNIGTKSADKIPSRAKSARSSVAASANLPALVMILFWPRVTRQGIIAGIVVGMVSSMTWILLSGEAYSKVYGLDAANAIVPFSQPGIVTIPLGFLTLVLVSLLTTGTKNAA